MPGQRRKCRKKAKRKRIKNKVVKKKGVMVPVKDWSALKEFLDLVKTPLSFFVIVLKIIKFFLGG